MCWYAACLTPVTSLHYCEHTLGETVQLQDGRLTARVPAIAAGADRSHMPHDTVRKKKKRKESTGNRADYMRDRISELEDTNLEMTQESYGFLK